MNVSFDYERLLPLISSLYTLSGVRADIYDVNFSEICISDDRAPFCALMNACPEGNARCVACDREAMKLAAGDKPYFYRCHAGICEAILPICRGGRPIAYLFYGQFLNEEDMETQWQRTAQTLGWYPGDMEQLHCAFREFQQLSREKTDAYTQILSSLAAYIQLEGLIQASEQTELQKLESYLDTHYREKLSLDLVARELHIGRTKLCALAKELSGGSTLSKMITQRRIEAAKELLRQGDAPVSAVAEAVGISDYNYFTKVFRSATGMTPSDYRRVKRRSLLRKYSAGD